MFMLMLTYAYAQEDNDRVLTLLDAMLGLKLKLRNDLISVLVNLLQHLSKIDSKHYQLKIKNNLKSCL